MQFLPYYNYIIAVLQVFIHVGGKAARHGD
ncbi:hypothetical protein CLS_16170 [[Clostridium] cf. saccharolyticum K10]|nr:hypothetical protein CLS_16170 [[Clostridium] cf. saccharolyticum K10]